MNENIQYAETIALKAVSYIFADPGYSERFLALTGATPENLKANLKDPGFLGAVLDYVLTDQSLLLGFCQHNDVDPHDFEMVRRRLPGAQATG